MVAIAIVDTFEFYDAFRCRDYHKLAGERVKSNLLFRIRFLRLRCCSSAIASLSVAAARRRKRDPQNKIFTKFV